MVGLVSPLILQVRDHKRHVTMIKIENNDFFPLIVFFYSSAICSRTPAD